MAIRFLNSGNISGNLEVNKSANAAVEIAKFKVTGTGGSFGAFSFVSILPGSGNFATQLRLHTNNTGNAFQSINNNAGVLELATNDSNPLVLKTNSTTRLTISNVGAATFTGLVSGITPTAAANFVTKAYADGLAPGAGVFLPLAGGTMSGNINMGDRKITNINEMSFGANAYITSPSNFLVRFNQTSVDVPSGDAIFGGTVIEDPNSLARKIEIAAADPVGLILNDTRDTHPITIANEGAVLNLKYNTTSMLSIDGATSNATFAGEVNATQFAASTSSTSVSVLRLIDAGVIAYDWTFPDTGTVRFGVTASSDKTLLLQNSGSGGFNLSVDNNGTFGGSIVSTGVNFINQSNQYNNSISGIAGYGNIAMDSTVSYYDTGKNIAVAYRGIVWTGKYYIITTYNPGVAYFYDNNFDPITNSEQSSVTLPNVSGIQYPHGGAWDGRYLYCIQYSPATIVVYDLDNGTGAATIVNSQALLNSGATYDIEYAEGHLYTCTDGKVSKYKVEGKTITHVFTSGDIAGSIEAQAITYDGSYLWITQNGANVYKVTLDCALVATITINWPPNNTGWAWNGQNIAAANYSTGDVYIINTAVQRWDSEKFQLMGGKVGIGTTSPDYILTTQGSGVQRLKVVATNPSQHSAGVYFLVKNGATQVGTGTIATQNNGDMDFYTGSSSEAFRMTILAGGNVGINTTSPSTKLSINDANYVEMATFSAATNSTAGIVANNSGYITGFTTSATHQSSNTALFVPVTDGIKITKAGLLQITTAQDFRSTTAANYAQVDIYKNTTAMFYSLRTNSNSQWDMLNSSGTMIVAANDVIKFRYAAGDFLSMDTGAWSQYSFVWTSR